MCPRTPLLWGSAMLAMIAAAVVFHAPSVAGEPTQFPPQWNALARKANAAMFHGDAASAISIWKRMYRYAPDRCMHDYLDTAIHAAHDVERAERSGLLKRGDAITEWNRRQAAYWAPNPCDRP